MNISPLDIKKSATAIAKSEKEAKAIANMASWIDSVYSRDDTRIIKNGVHNLCRYYILQGDRFIPWLAKMIPSKSTLGLYIAKTNTERWEINDRMSIAADTGRIPQTMNDVAVIQSRSASKAIEYARRAEEKLSAKITIVHDETGKRDDDALLKSYEIEKIDMTQQITEYGKAIRFIGEMSGRERVQEIFRYNAKKVCEDILRRRLEEIVGPVALTTKSAPQMNVPADIVSLVTCGHRNDNVSLAEYSADGFRKAEIWENASYNVPFDTVDRRAFTFTDTTDVLERFCKHSDILDELCDIEQIWKYAARLAGESSCDMFAISSMCYDVSNRPPSGAKTRNKKRKKAQSAFGIEAMVDSYYSGVPLEDIMA